jgi:hypothetical protein
MKVYLASWFASKDEMKKRAEDLQKLGIESTARWINEVIDGQTQIKDVDKSYLKGTARIDIEDILTADTMILNVPSEEDLESYNLPLSTWARGGRHFEAGFQYATMFLFEQLPEYIKERGVRKLILVGHKENVFHYLDDLESNGSIGEFDLPSILTFADWEEACKYLTRIREEAYVVR